MTPEELAQRFVAVWNEADQGARRREIEALWRPDGRHLMGAQDARGYDGLEARVAASHRRSVVEGRNVFRPPTMIQALEGVIKFRWDMAARDSGEIAAAGVGFLALDDEGRIATDYLFTEG